MTITAAILWVCAVVLLVVVLKMLIFSHVSQIEAALSYWDGLLIDTFKTFMYAYPQYIDKNTLSSREVLDKAFNEYWDLIMEFVPRSLWLYLRIQCSKRVLMNRARVTLASLIERELAGRMRM